MRFALSDCACAPNSIRWPLFGFQPRAAAPGQIAIVAFLTRAAVVDAIVVIRVDVIQLLRRRERRGRREAPLQVADHRGVGGGIERVRVRRIFVLAKHRSTRDHRRAQRLSRRQVDRDLGLAVGETERGVRGRVDLPQQPVDVAFPNRHHPARVLVAAKRPLEDGAGGRRADHSPHGEPLARSVAGREIEARPQVRVEALRMRAGQERRGFEDVAVDQRQRAGVLHAADGVKQQRAVDAVDRNADVLRSEPANRELGAEVVAGRDSG